MPTETVYGLAGSAFDPLALARIFETKERPTFDPLIVHVGVSARGLSELERIGLVRTESLSPLARERAEKLMAAFWPGPLTLVLPRGERVPDLVTSGLPTVGVRMPRHSVAQALIALAGVPLAAPSANRFGRVSPTTAQAVAEELGERIDLIIDGGACEVGLESTVVAVMASGDLYFLRPGGVAREELERAAGVAISDGTPVHRAGAGGPAASPGLLESHYAPSCPVSLLSGSFGSLTDRELAAAAARTGHLGLLLQAGDAASAAERLQRVTGARVTARALSGIGDPREVAHTLFAGLRALDDAGCGRILAEPPRSLEGLGHAIADRLGRASAGR
jgi:L-threonylcarbamoyladenylate synthase